MSPDHKSRPFLPDNGLERLRNALLNATRERERGEERGKDYDVLFMFFVLSPPRESSSFLSKQRLHRCILTQTQGDTETELQTDKK